MRRLVAARVPRRPWVLLVAAQCRRVTPVCYRHVTDEPTETPMPEPVVEVTSRVVYTVRCSECGVRVQHESADQAETDRAAHRARHVHSRVIAATIAPDVFVSESDDKPWFGVITAAQEAADLAGKPYLTWNGHVYRTANIDFADPVCWASDVLAIIGAAT